ncbi:MAG: hypothetical protein U0599_06370 [Vicinamibacteria bacterium]
MASGRACSTLASASAAVAARVTEKPARPSTYSTNRPMCGSSSTTSTCDAVRGAGLASMAGEWASTGSDAGAAPDASAIRRSSACRAV